VENEEIWKFENVKMWKCGDPQLGSLGNLKALLFYHT
jgi:hypothetical protein